MGNIPKNNEPFVNENIHPDLLNFYFNLKRGTNEQDIIYYIKNIERNPFLIEDFLVLMFQTRNPRGGKGERKLFYTIFLYLYKYFNSELMKPLLSLIPKYGSFKDLNILWEKADMINFYSLKRDIIQLYALYINIDNNQQDNTKLTFAAKWAPRESGHYRDMARDLARKLYPDKNMKIKTVYKNYRRLISSINKRLETTEIAMCYNNWHMIVPEKVPKKCLEKNKDAFLNVYQGQLRTYEENRIMCGNKFMTYLTFMDTVEDLNRKFRNLSISDIQKTPVDSEHEPAKSLKEILNNSKYNDIRNIYKTYINIVSPTTFYINPMY